MSGSKAEERFSPALRDFVALAKEKLYPAPQGDLFAHAREFVRGDHMLNPDFTDRIGANAPRPAAVLVPIVAHEAPTVLLTQRSKHLSTHAGQVAFPGGRIDPGDASPLAAALREADEEVGLPARYATPLGYLDSYLSGTGFRIVPVVALIEPGFSLKINEAEVDEAFEVPLSFLMTRENHARHSGVWKGVERHFYAMPFEQRNIWGATAGIIRSLYEKLYE
ncbi:MAG: CoA pyrophosphatase [Xanthobacteraceae bacterium]|nr:CoA pyrophosphatase [Xanthobacteraceae bacterium]